MEIADRAGNLIERLGLQPHPEGGHYGEIFRSSSRVDPGDGRTRAAATVIYFLLPAGTVSRWHRVRADEVWQHVEGGPLELLLVSPEDDRLSRVRVGPFDEGGTPVQVVPAGWWQAACPLGAYALVNCTVAPGFEFDDFELLGDDAEESARLRRMFPETDRFV